MLTYPLPLDSPTPPCADPAALPVVDAAYARPGGPEGRYMAREICGPCPVSTACLAHAMRYREEGVWGGTTPTARTRSGAPGSRETGRTRKAVTSP